MSFELKGLGKLDDKGRMDELINYIKIQAEDEDDPIALMSNISSFIMAIISDLNWSGFYIVGDDNLKLGPFQGLPACTRLNYDSGVCAKAYRDKKITNIEDVSKFDLLVLSPGISVNAPIAQMFRDQEKPVWSEIELAYQASKGRIAAITGTNGKTTTTALTGEIMKGYYESSFVVGNIGIPYTSVALDTKEDSVTTAEISSFQLETIVDFKPDVCAVLNITPDHLDRHGTVEVYAQTKESIGKNQTKDQVMVLNYEDDTTRAMADRANGTVLFFSLHHKIKEGV